MWRITGGSLIALAALTASSWAFDRTELDKKLEELKSSDAKVRAAALADLGAINIDLNFAIMDMGIERDPSPEVAAVRRELKAKLDAREKAAHQRKSGESSTQINEKAAIDSCKLYAMAQEIYHRTDYAKTGTLAYAQHLKGENSLLEIKAGANDLQLIDEVLGNAEGNPGKATPKAGYCFKILTKQGANATGGARDYIKNGKMVLGYALIAYPADYGASGTNCFMVNNNGVVFKKDLGADTHKIVEATTEFDPDKTWGPTQ